MSSYLHADQPDGNGPLNVTPEREALIERLAAESRAKQQDRFEELPVDSALDFLVNASRVSPVLRAKVQIVEDEIRRLRAEVAFVERLVMNVAVRCVRDPDVAEDMVADEREQMQS